MIQVILLAGGRAYSSVREAPEISSLVGFSWISGDLNSARSAYAFSKKFFPQYYSVISYRGSNILVP